MAQYLGCPLVGDFNLYIRKEKDVEKDEVLDTLITVTEDYPTKTFLFEVFSRLFKGKYYSNNFNFAQVLEKMQLDTKGYNVLLERLTNLGIIDQVGERVYELADGVTIEERLEKDG